MKPTRLFILTLFAMIAFAGNSLLCRLALKHTSIDAASFTFIRIFSGAAALLLIMKYQRGMEGRRKLAFRAGTLRLRRRLFVCLQQPLRWNRRVAPVRGGPGHDDSLGVRKGERLHVRQLVGLVLALGGLVVLLFPGLSAPPLTGSILMLGAGLAWGIYSLRGKAAGDPTGATTGNFLRAVPLAAMVSIFLFQSAQLDRAGIGYAVLSGALASGVGYVIWYTALPGLRAASAATVQLSVPVLAATGGIILLGEPLTLRFLCASIAVLGGIALVVMNPLRGIRRSAS